MGRRGNIQEEVDEAGFDAADIDRDLIAERLKKDVDEFSFILGNNVDEWRVDCNGSVRLGI
jgi:hypothetical protein